MLSAYTGLSTLGEKIRLELLIKLNLTSLLLTDELSVRKEAEKQIDSHFKQFFTSLRREVALDFSKQENPPEAAQEDKWDSYWDTIFGAEEESSLSFTY